MSNPENPMTAPTASSPGPSSASRALVAGVVLLGIIMLIALAAYVFRSQSAAPKAPAAIAPAAVSITVTGFSPSTVSVKKGQAVTWTNTDNVGQSIVSDRPNPLFKSQSLSQGATYSYVFNNVGSYAYHDGSNIQFAGKVVVK